MKKYFVKNVDANSIKMVKQKVVFKNIFVVVVIKLFQKRTSTKSPYRGISHHKICIVSSIDENDNLLLKIVGLGRCTTNMLKDSLDQKLSNAKSVNADSASVYQDFCEEYNLTLNAIPPGFHSDGIYYISEINGVHSQLETWLSKFRGVSTRHLQEYLDWFVYIFTMKERFMLRKIKT